MLLGALQHPRHVHSLPKDVKGVGTLGLNTDRQSRRLRAAAFAGPGTRTYVSPSMRCPRRPNSPMRHPASPRGLLAAMKDKILASADLSVTYTRYTEADTEQGPGEDRRRRLGAMVNARRRDGR